MSDAFVKCNLNNLRLEPKSLSIENLIENCLAKLDGPVQRDVCDPLVLAFILLHEWYIDSAQLINLLCKRLQADRRLWLNVIRLLNIWVHLFPQAFCDQAQTTRQAVDKLKSWASENVPSFEANNFLNVVGSRSSVCSRYPSIKQPLAAKVSLSFDQWSPDDLAVSLTHIENRLLRRISFREYKRYAVNNQLNSVPCLRKSIATFNSISQWIQCMILNKTTASERAQVMIKFVKVARTLKELQNFNTLMAVVGALTHSAIARLSRTMVCVPNHIRLELMAFSNLLSSAANFSVYRKVLCMSPGFRVPIIGVHLKDLISLHAALPDYLGDQRVNCQKFTQLASIFSHLIFDVQQTEQLPSTNESLLNTLKVALNVEYNDEEIYYLSLKREPKTLLQPAVQSSPVLADWAAGVQNRVDSSAMQKHVNAMVEAIFRHYDLNHDGYISKQEFDLIRTNFPLFDRFVTLDSNRDGRISKSEMKVYFMHLRRSQRADSNHHFRMTNALAPSFCHHCKRLAWNLLRPELKCENCGIVIHRNCEEAHSSNCFRRRNTEPTHRRCPRPPRSPDAKERDQFQENTVGRGSLFLLKRSRRRLQHNANADGQNCSVSPKLRSYSEGGPCYKHVRDVCESMATLACEEVFESD